MKFFYLSITTIKSDTSEIHSRDCTSLPSMDLRTYLGPFNNSREALRKALEKNENVEPCPDCCKNEGKDVTFFSNMSLEER